MMCCNVGGGFMLLSRAALCETPLRKRRAALALRQKCTGWDAGMYVGGGKNISCA